MKKSLIFLLFCSCVLMFGCKKEDNTAWIESRDYYVQFPNWWGDGLVPERKLHLTRYFQSEGVKILAIETYSERMNRLNRPHHSRGIIYLKIYRKDFPIMQEYEFKLMSD